MKTKALLGQGSCSLSLQRDLENRIILEEQRQIKKQLEVQELKEGVEEIKSHIPTLEEFKSKLEFCGKWFKITAECKPCLFENRHKNPYEKFSPIVSVEKIQHFCKIKYCPKIECIIKRFSDLLNNLKTIKEFKGYRTLWHFAIGFEAIPLEDFINNFDSISKRSLAVTNSYFKKLRKLGIALSGVRVWDYSFVKNGMVFPHFNIAVKPIEKIRRGIVMKKMQEVRKDMISRMKIKTPFHLQIFKHGKKESVLSYIAVRGVGLYKYGFNESFKNFKPKKLRESIENKEFLILKDIMTEEQYLIAFWNRRSYTTFGSVSYGSNIRDNVVYECKRHGVLNPKININFIIEEMHSTKLKDKPPDRPEILKIEVIYLGGDI